MKIISNKNLDKIPANEPTTELAQEATLEPEKEVTPTKHKKSKLKQKQELMNETIYEKIIYELF